jgi:uncharacterized metal-binding protein
MLKHILGLFDAVRSNYICCKTCGTPKPKHVFPQIKEYENEDCQRRHH